MKTKNVALFKTPGIHLVIVLIAVIGLAGGVQALENASCVEMAVPSYFYEESLWSENAEGSGIMIMNPNNGPDLEKSEHYVNQVRNAKANGVKVYGYVYTSYGKRNPAAIKRDIDRYNIWYGVDGIFFDETATWKSKAGHYRNLTDYAKSKGMKNILNPGVTPNEEYFKFADSIVVFEDSYKDYLSARIPSFVNKYPGKAVHLVYGADEDEMKNAMNLARQRGASYIYVTDDDLDNPWDSLPYYWQEEVMEMAGLCR